MTGPTLPASARLDDPAAEPSRTALIEWWDAIHVGRTALVRQRLAEDPRWAHRPSPRGESALHEVLATPDYGGLQTRLDLINALLPHSNVRWDDEHPGAITPLMLAAQSCQMAVLRRLLPRSNPRAATVWGTTALIMAARCGHEEVVAELLPLSDPQAAEQDGTTAAMAAARNGRNAALEVLWPSVDPTVCDASGDTVVLHAARHGLASIVERWMNDPTSDRLVRNHAGDGVVEAWQQWVHHMAGNGYIDQGQRQTLLQRLTEQRVTHERTVLLGIPPSTAATRMENLGRAPRQRL